MHIQAPDRIVDLQIPAEFIADRYVACLDVMGIRARLRTQGVDGVAAMYAGIVGYVEVLKSAAAVGAGPLGTIQFFQGIEVAVFSDSIFLFSSGLDFYIDGISQLSNLIFQQCLARDVPISGGIASGRTVVWPERGVYVGDGIVAAYELQNKIDIIGVVADPTLRSTELDGPALVPIKGGAPEHLKFPGFLRPGTAAGTLLKPNPDDVQAGFLRCRNAAPPAKQHKYDNGRALLERTLRQSFAQYP